jgi:YVTN family beta-propeller protein
LSFTPDGRLLVSATNEITLVDPKTLTISQRIGNLGVTQLLYSKAAPDGRHVLAPAVWEGQVVVIDLKTEQVVTRIVTGIDPVQVMISPDNLSAYVTHGRSRWLSEIDLSGFSEKRRIETLGGPNGAAFAPWSPAPARRKMLTLGACLPFTGESAVEGREIRLGYQFWQERVNSAGGLIIDGAPHVVQIVYADTASTNDSEKIKSVAQRLISDHPVQLLLGSYPEIGNLSLAQIAEERKLPFVVGSGVADELFERNYKYLSAVVSDRFRFDCVLHGIWRRLSPKPRTVALLTCDERFSRERARATAARLRQLGLSLVTPKDDGGVEEPGIIVYKHLSSDLLPVIQKIQELNPDIVLHHGHRQEAVGLAQACQQADFTPGAIALDFGITLAGFRDQMEGLLDCLIGSVHWSQTMPTFARDRFTGPSDFARNYFEEFSERASSLAAAAAACGIVVEHALHEVQTAKPDRVQMAIRGLDFESFFGHIKFGRVAGGIEEIPLWPPSTANRNTLCWPFPAWPRIKS